MAAGIGYSKITTNGLVFSYDVGDQRNSYKGKPAYNVASSVGYNIGNNNVTYDPTHYFITTIGTETVNIPALGIYNNVKYVTINNGYTGYGDGGNYNCCPSLFGYGSGMTTGVTGNTLYTYSIIYKTVTGYTHPNFMYRYEYNGGTYITEQGIFDTSKRVDLGDGWYWAYNTFTTNASCTNLSLGMWYYQYNTPDKIWVKDAMIVQGDYKIPPLNFLSGNQTRSNTQGLLDLSGRENTLDLTNMSYDSNAQMTFDGTNNYLNFPSGLNTSFANNQITVIAVGKVTNTVSKPTVLTFNGNFNFFFPGNRISSSLPMMYWDSGVSWKTGNTSNAVGTTYFFAWTINGTSLSFYRNGILDGTATVTNFAPTSGAAVRIGLGNAGEYMVGSLNAYSIYNRALSAAEIRDSYSHYKTRFNLT